MHNGVVDACTARCCAVQYFFGFVIITKVVKCQRFFVLIDICYWFSYIVESHNWKNGAENLALHYCMFGFHIVNNGGSYVSLFEINFATPMYVAFVQQSRQSAHSFVIYNAREETTSLYIISIHLFGVKHNLVEQFIFDRMVCEKIIGRNACLPCIDQFPKDNALCSYVYVGIFVHYARTFTTQLKHNGSKMLGGCFHHHFTYFRTTSKEHQIEALFKQQGVGLFPSLN